MQRLCVVLIAILGAPVLSARPSDAGSGEPAWRRCARGWGAPPQALAALESRSVFQEPDDLLWVAAVITVESAWRTSATSPKGASGAMQLTDEGAAEAALECRLPVVPAAQLRGWGSSVRYGTCLLRFDLREADGDWDEALMLYNGGLRQLARYRRGLPLVEETRQYLLKVKQLHSTCIGGG